jgi:hypothetical protein
MALAYLQYDKTVLERGRIIAPNEPSPRSAENFSPKQLLPWND